ncbi:hypothetical protein LUZ60_007764 [Juncus effusus]|nr:hypothetical protein LUZ60_007764 [Juncus effusus]
MGTRVMEEGRKQPDPWGGAAERAGGVTSPRSEIPSWSAKVSQGREREVCVRLGESGDWEWRRHHRRTPRGGSRVNDGSASELLTVDDESGPSPASAAPRKAATWRSGRIARANPLIQCGLLILKKQTHPDNQQHNGPVVNNDVRLPSHDISAFSGAHTAEVCGLRRSNCGQHLVSGGNDGLVGIWSLGSTNPVRWFRDHMAAVKALAWCMHRNNVLVTGGGEADRCIKFWNVSTGDCLNSVDTVSQVCRLVWNKNEKELLSSHGPTQNQLTLWKYSSMAKLADLRNHTSRVVYMAQSPDGCSIATVARDETLRVWNVFGVSERKKLVAVKKRTIDVLGPTNMYSFMSRYVWT